MTLGVLLHSLTYFRQKSSARILHGTRDIMRRWSASSIEDEYRQGGPSPPLVIWGNVTIATDKSIARSRSRLMCFTGALFGGMPSLIVVDHLGTQFGYSSSSCLVQLYLVNGLMSVVVGGIAGNGLDKSMTIPYRTCSPCIGLTGMI